MLVIKFGVCLSDVSKRVPTLSFYSHNILILSLFALADNSCREALMVSSLFLRRLGPIFAEAILCSDDTSPKEKYASHFKALIIHFLFIDI